MEVRGRGGGRQAAVRAAVRAAEERGFGAAGGGLQTKGEGLVVSWISLLVVSAGPRAAGEC